MWIVFKKDVNRNGEILPANTPFPEDYFTEEELEGFETWSEQVKVIGPEGFSWEEKPLVEYMEELE